MVREGNIVIDCGAHVGAYSAQALALGAEKVIAIDPDPTQVECLRRNFAVEIAEGRLIVVPKAIWSSEGSMTLNVGTAHSAMSSLFYQNGGDEVEVLYWLRQSTTWSKNWGCPGSTTSRSTSRARNAKR